MVVNSRSSAWNSVGNQEFIFLPNVHVFEYFLKFTSMSHAMQCSLKYLFLRKYDLWELSMKN